MKEIKRFEQEIENPNNAHATFYNKLKTSFEFEDFTDEEIKILKSRHDEILEIAHNEVCKYLADGASTGIDGDDWFPSWGRLTGKYYIGSEDYYKREDGGIQISVFTRFTDIRDDLMIEDGRVKIRQYKDDNEERIFEEMDYLGLEVWIYADSVTAEFEEVDEIDSSSI